MRLATHPPRPPRLALSCASSPPVPPIPCASPRLAPPRTVPRCYQNDPVHHVHDWTTLSLVYTIGHSAGTPSTALLALPKHFCGKGTEVTNIIRCIVREPSTCRSFTSPPSQKVGWIVWTANRCACGRHDIVRTQVRTLAPCDWAEGAHSLTRLTTPSVHWRWVIWKVLHSYAIPRANCKPR